MNALSKPQRMAIANACRRHHVARLHAFGSLLRPDYRPGESDIDLLVEFESLQPSDLVEAYFGLEQQLNASLGSAVDLVMATAVRNPFVRAFIGGRANRRISDKAPASYIPELIAASGSHPFTSQCIPTDPALLPTECYREFLAERRRSIAERLNAFMGSPGDSS